MNTYQAAEVLGVSTQRALYLRSAASSRDALGRRRRFRGFWSVSDLVAARCAHLIIRSGIGTKCAEGVLRAIAGNTLIPGKNAWLVIGRQHEERPACAVALSDEDMLRVVFSEHGNLCTVIPLDPVIGDVALAIQRVLQP